MLATANIASSFKILDFLISSSLEEKLIGNAGATRTASYPD
jgi:hypothetical protein